MICTIFKTKQSEYSGVTSRRALETKTTTWPGCWTLNNSVSQTRGQFIFFIFRLSCYAQVEVAVDVVETKSEKKTKIKTKQSPQLSHLSHFCISLGSQAWFYYSYDTLVWPKRIYRWESNPALKSSTPF